MLMSYYGPSVIIAKEMGLGETEEQYLFPERKHWDECVEFVTELLDEAAELMQPTTTPARLGHATSVAALALKARILLYSASPLVNGNSEFYSQFKNSRGEHLIPQSYDKEKWKTALDAIEEAITLAEESGHELYQNASAATLPNRDRGEINYHDLFVEPEWINNREYLWGLSRIHI